MAAVEVGRSSVTVLKPHQPDPKTIVCQVLRDKTLKFQAHWYQEFAWLHFEPGIDGSLCFYCHKAFKNKTSELAKNSETTFIISGFKNWKKARERFTLHAGSACHKTAITTYIYESRPIDVHLSIVLASQQKEARKCLLKIISAVQFLARQALSFRDHDDDEGNFNQLLKYKSENDPSLSKWLSLKTDYTCPQIQN